MKMRLVPALVTPILMLVAAPASADWPPPFWEEVSYATTAAPAGVTPVLFNLPDGAGAPFTQARASGGLVVDATITLHLLDSGGNPIAMVPAAEMWLEREIVSGTGNFVACLGGTLADGPTGPDGVTQWTQPLRAGGWSTSRTLVVVWGNTLATNSGLVLQHNSADLNGDGVVNLADVPLFAADFAGSYHFRSDLRYDGVVNLSDIPRLVLAMGAGCP